LVCDCCEIREETCKDYRPDELGNVNKCYVCDACVTLNNEWFHKIQCAISEERRKYLMRQCFDQEHWEELGIEEPCEIKVMSWNIKLYWSDGEETTLDEIPDQISQTIDDIITDIEKDIEEEKNNDI